MNWTFSLERLPSPDKLNYHTVQVISQPRDPLEALTVRLWRNIDSHDLTLSRDDPIILYVEVKLSQSPVVGARVTASVEGINQTGHVVPSFSVELKDNGAGDPDLSSEDWIYYRYLMNFPGGEGRYQC